MKNAIIALMLVFGFVGSSYAGDCAGGVCRAPLQSVRKAVIISKNIVLAPVRAVTVVVAPKNACETVITSDGCDCGCSNSVKTKEVVKYQPLRRRLINRSTTVSCQN